MLSLGIRLVIILPTLLFLLGYFYKCIISVSDWKKVINSKLNEDDQRKFVINSFKSFVFIMGLDSLFIFLANGLIIIFELGFNEMGIISLLVGAVIVVALLLTVYVYDFKWIRINFGIIGFILGLELAYFLTMDWLNSALSNYDQHSEIILSILIGLLVGLLFAMSLKEKLLGPVIFEQFMKKNKEE